MQPLKLPQAVLSPTLEPERRQVTPREEDGGRHGAGAGAPPRGAVEYAVAAMPSRHALWRFAGSLSALRLPLLCVCDGILPMSAAQ